MYVNIAYGFLHALPSSVEFQSAQLWLLYSLFQLNIRQTYHKQFQENQNEQNHPVKRMKTFEGHFKAQLHKDNSYYYLQRLCIVK